VKTGKGMKIREKYRQLRKAFEHALKMEMVVNNRLCIHHYHQSALSSQDVGIEPESSVVVSLTTHSKRIFEVYLTIESILQQTLKPSRIILWLGVDEFTEDDIPLVLKKQVKRGLEIRYCDDLRSYTKLVPTLQLLPEATIITIDDDYIYPFDFIERLVYTHRQFPQCVCYYKGGRMGLDNGGKVLPYLQWVDDEAEYTPSCLNFGAGVGGVLYPSGSFHADVTDASLFRRYAPMADDIWFKAMTLLHDIEYVKVPLECTSEWKFISLENTQDIGLYLRNVRENKNDVQIRQTFDRYQIETRLKKYI